MISFSSKYRTQQEEIMDDFDFHGPELHRLLDDLSTVNRWLGGNRDSIDGLRKLLRNQAPDEPLTIVDLGCGDGQTLRACDKWLQPRYPEYRLIGLDANPHIIQEARNRSANHKRIQFECVDVLSDKLLEFPCDIALFSLFLHHFDNEEIHLILKRVWNQVGKGMVVSDLQRSRLAFALFRLFGRIILRTNTAYTDGLISISRGFTVSDLKDFSRGLDASHSISKTWAFRLQWLIQKK